MKYILILIIICSEFANAQDTLSSTLVEPFSYEFDLKNRHFIGAGAEILLEEVQRSQFVLLGETHGDAKIAEFTDILLDTLSSMSFKYFITEHGRYGLQFLIEDIKQDSSITNGLYRVNTNEYMRLNKFPFPFLSGIEDAKFMSTAVEKGYELYGIDQEFYYSFPYLFDRLYAQNRKSSEIDKSYIKALTYMLSQYKNEQQDKDYPICKNFLESTEIKKFLDEINCELDFDEIKKDIVLSWNIYEKHISDRRESVILRGSLMTSRFQDYLDGKMEEDLAIPKFIIKLGALHTVRGVTPLGIKDVGEVVHQAANLNRTNDVNVYFMFRYYQDDGEELGYFDNAEGNSKWLNELKPLMLQGKPDKWILINLKALGMFIKSNNLFVFHPIADMIQGHDFIIIPPASKDVTENKDNI
ncbi:MAG: hypothetical protein H6567_06885 [Lewinellaceae bacterium]|nr:hypothetical protein [Lewinellaceae bacterium]